MALLCLRYWQFLAISILSCQTTQEELLIPQYWNWSYSIVFSSILLASEEEFNQQVYSNRFSFLSDFHFQEISFFSCLCPLGFWNHCCFRWCYSFQSELASKLVSGFNFQLTFCSNLCQSCQDFRDLQETHLLEWSQVKIDWFLMMQSHCFLWFLHSFQLYFQPPSERQEPYLIQQMTLDCREHCLYYYFIERMHDDPEWAHSCQPLTDALALSSPFWEESF